MKELVNGRETVTLLMKSADEDVLNADTQSSRTWMSYIAHGHLGHKTVMDFLICTSDIPKVSNFMSNGVRLSRLLKFNKIGRFCKGNG